MLRVILRKSVCSGRNRMTFDSLKLNIVNHYSVSSSYILDMLKQKFPAYPDITDLYTITQEFNTKFPAHLTIDTDGKTI